MAKITYDNKETLNPQPSVADVNKVTSGDMNEIKQVVNTNYGEVGDITNLTTTNKSSVVSAVNEIAQNEIYSTTETNTGKIWIDGKPIYRKVISINATSTLNSDIWADTGLTAASIDNIWIAGGFYRIDVGFIPVNFFNPWLSGTYDTLTYINTSSNNIRIGYKLKRQITGGAIILEYTKAS